MLNDSLFSVSFENLKSFVINDLTIFDLALSYILLYVVYMVIGRYIYFKPQEHASKINRTFLVISLLIVLLDLFGSLSKYLPFIQEYRWIFTLCSIVLLIAPFSILMDWIVWRYDEQGNKYLRYQSFMPLQSDYYKTPIPKSTSSQSYINNWEEEGVESTNKNLHSDTLLNFYSLCVFLYFTVSWSMESMTEFGIYSIAFSTIISIWITLVFFDRCIFSWITYSTRRLKWIMTRKKK